MSSAPSRARRRVALALAVSSLAAGALAPAAGAAPTLDLESLTAPQAEKMMAEGTLTSVELTQAYVARIDALNKRGPGLNAVSQLNADALREAAASDARRKAGALLGPADGLPILMKDLIDVKGMYTSNGNYSLRNSYPQKDAGLVKHLRERGVVILGKTGLSEFANYFGSQHSGFSNLIGQVLNAVDTDADVSGSSSGTGSAGAAALSALTIGTETSGSIISPSNANGIVGLRPTVGLVPGVGIGPISASQDTAGPMDRTVSNAAMTLQSIAGYDEDNANYYKGIWGPGVNDADVLPPVPKEVPDYLSALDLDFVKGKRIGWNGTRTPGGPLDLAMTALEKAGAILVNRPAVAATGLGSTDILRYEAHRDVTHYYQHLGPDAPIKSLEEEIAANQAEADQALKFGNGTHAASAAVDISDDSAASVAYRKDLVDGKRITHKAIEDTLNNETPNDPSDDFIAILGSVSSGARAGYPQLTIPMGYNAAQRRPVNISVNGGAYSERDLIGVAYVIEQGTKLRQKASEVNPSMYRCAKTVPAPVHADRGDCNPDYDAAMQAAGGSRPELGFSLETATAKDLLDKLNAGRLSSETLTRAYLARIALTNAEGPATQAVRALNPDAIAEARASDAQRAAGGTRRRLEGLPVLLSDVIDDAGMATTGGSVALQDSRAKADAALVAKLKAAGAIILGKTNVSELNGVFDANQPEGYSSLGGQTLLPVDTWNPWTGSSAGAAAATSTGLAAMTVGTETSTDTAQMIAPAGSAGVVALKPTVGRVSRTGILPTATSQDSPGPITQTVYDAALGLQAMAGTDASDSATSGAPAVPNYLGGLTTTALSGKRVAYLTPPTNSNGTTTPFPAPYPSVLTTLQGLGATTTAATAGTVAAPSVTRTAFKRDLNAYLAGTTGSGAKTLKEIIDYDTAHADEALKYGQGELTAADAVDLGDAATASAYDTNRTTGKAQAAAILDGILNNGTPADTSDDNEIIAVPSGNALVNVADRAGYPVLTVPAGYGTGSTGGNPQSVVFIGPAYGEAKLLADGYAFEQATKVRKAPSVTNPSMFRCVPGSVFFTAEKCNPGDRASTFAFDPIETTTPDAPTTPADPANPGTPTTPADPAGPATPTTPAGPKPPATTPGKAPLVRIVSRSVRMDAHGRFGVRVSCPKGAGSCRIRVLAKRGSATLGTRTITLKAGQTFTVRMRPNPAMQRSLRRGKAVTVKVSLTAGANVSVPKATTVKVAPRSTKR